MLIAGPLSFYYKQMYNNKIVNNISKYYNCFISSLTFDIFLYYYSPNYLCYKDDLLKYIIYYY